MRMTARQINHALSEYGRRLHDLETSAPVSVPATATTTVPVTVELLIREEPFVQMAFPRALYYSIAVGVVAGMIVGFVVAAAGIY